MKIVITEDGDFLPTEIYNDKGELAELPDMNHDERRNLLGVLFAVYSHYNEIITELWPDDAKPVNQKSNG